MPWRDFLKRKQPDEPTATAAAPPQPAAPPRRALPLAGTSSSDPAAQERRRKRLERRVADLRYDVAQAEAALVEPNRWTERIEQLTRAIEQAQQDITAMLRPPVVEPPLPLPPTPVTVEAVQPAEPAEVRLRVGEVTFRYAESLDWAERGHQKAEPVLERREGDIAALVPPGTPPARAAALEAHLAHALSSLAEGLRDAALAGASLPSLTLADLASPCPACGGWRDQRGRCPACQERQWRVAQLEAGMERLRKERHELTEELARMRDRLPVLRRQLAEAERELAHQQQ